jgi:hypothetical protein
VGRRVGASVGLGVDVATTSSLSTAAHGIPADLKLEQVSAFANTLFASVMKPLPIACKSSFDCLPV